jgi:hypothetical protein
MGGSKDGPTQQSIDRLAQGFAYDSRGSGVSSGRGTGIDQVFWWFHMEVLYEEYERLLIIGLDNR